MARFRIKIRIRFEEISSQISTYSATAGFIMTKAT